MKLVVELVPSEHFETRLNGRVLEAAIGAKVNNAAVLAGLDPQLVAKSSVRITTAIPVASGLGSSAALCVALATLARDVSSPDSLEADERREIFKAAHRAEGVFHGRSSGADPAGALSDAPVLYHAEGTRIETFEAAAGAPYVWGLLPSGVERSTARVISTLVEAREEALMASLIDVSARIPSLLQGGDWTALPAALEEAGHLHREMGLVNEALEKVFARMRAEGAVATKLTGAGRGGFALGLYPLERARALSPKSEHLLVPLRGNKQASSDR
jgi:mevalonate kinase